MSDVSAIKAFAADPYSSALLRSAVEALANIELSRIALVYGEPQYFHLGEEAEDDGFITLRPKLSR